MAHAARRQGHPSRHSVAAAVTRQNQVPHSRQESLTVQTKRARPEAHLPSAGLATVYLTVGID